MFYEERQVIGVVGGMTRLPMDEKVAEEKRMKPDGTEQAVEGYDYNLEDVETGGLVDRDSLISGLIHARYSINQEIAIIRQKDDSEERLNEFKTYSTYADECKTRVDELINRA